jgi:carbamoyl-phosphate synthase large subunit
VAEHSPDRHTIAVTGVGALIGQGIARSLRPAGRARIVGIDRRITPFSQSFCDICEQKPEADEASEAYLDFWRNLVRTHSIDLILPGLSVDMEFFNTHVQPLKRWACRLP